MRIKWPKCSIDSFVLCVLVLHYFICKKVIIELIHAYKRKVLGKENQKKSVQKIFLEQLRITGCRTRIQKINHLHRINFTFFF